MKLNKLPVIGGMALLLPLFLISCGPHHHCRKDGEERMLRHLDDKVEDLELNSEQEAKYREIRAKVAAEMKATMDNRKAGMEIMEDELKKPEPDLEKAVKAMQDNYKKKPSDMTVFGDHFLEFYAILNPEQKKEVQEELRSKMKRMSCQRK